MSINRKRIFIGSALELRCPFENFTNVEWVKDSHFYQVDGNSTTIHFDSIKIGNSGNYTCFADNVAGRSNYTYQVRVIYPPRIRSVSDDYAIEEDPAAEPTSDNEIEVNEGDPLTLNCSMIGSPAPAYSWTKDG